MQKLFFIYLVLFVSISGKCQKIELERYKVPFHANGISIYHLNADTLFPEKQDIFVAEIKREALFAYDIQVSYSDSALKRTSLFGEENRALVALNGSFFNVEKGGSVAYLESEGKVIARTRNSKEKWAKTDSLLNGAFVLGKEGKFSIELARKESFYEQSSDEKAVLVSGPELLAGGKRLPLENSEFVKKRHPRSCLCETFQHSLLMIAVDGRSSIASGMNLMELQDFLIRLNCINAINLDGGGSTTLWVDNGGRRGILNKPSDKEGERPVANCILIKGKTTIESTIK